MKLLAVDPGARSLAWALYTSSELVACGMLEGDGFIEQWKALVRVMRPDQGAIEVPQIYREKNWKGDPNDCIDVAVSAGIAECAMSPAPVKRYRPRQWKGNKTKAVDHRQIRLILSNAELFELRDCAVPKGKLHNVLDAIGIGLRFLERRQRYEDQ